MIRSAPSRRAAITPHWLTAPSPTTAAVFPGPAFAESAALIPILDSVVQAYLIRHDPDMPPSGAFGERAITLVRSYKRDVDSKRAVLREIRRELARRARARSPRRGSSTS
jgi:heme exporter protein D